MKTSEKIKRGLECCDFEQWHNRECGECPYMNADDEWCESMDEIRHDAIAYIQQLETENHQLLTKAQQLESTISQVSKALCGKEKATLKELLQAADQLKTRAPRWISVEERLPGIKGSSRYCQHVIVLMKNKEVFSGLCNGDLWYVMRDEDAYCTWAYGGEVTHWMPLPEPPKEE